MLLALLLWAAAADPAVERLIDSAFAAPPEFAAGALLRVLEGGGVSDRKRAISLAETAFDLAAIATRQVPCGFCSERPREGALLLEAAACSLGLDRASLQRRAVDVLAKLDVPRSLEYAERLPPAEQRQPRCLAGTPAGTIRLDDLPKESPGADLKGRWQSLMFGTSGRMLPDDRKQTAEWKDQFDQLLRDVESRQLPDEMGQAERLEAESGMLGLLWWAAPAGADRDRVFTRYLESVRRSPLQREDPVLWFAGVKSVLDLVTSTQPDQREGVLNALETSGSAVLSLYARLEKSVPSR